MSDRDLREAYPTGGPPESPIEQIPTHQAAANNRVEELADLVQEGSTLVGTDTKETPLHAAAKRGAMDTLMWLLEKKTVSPLEKAGNGNTAAHYAAVYGHLETLKLLVEHDPSLSEDVVSQTDDSGLSLVSLATLQGDEDMTRWLIDNYPEIGDIANANGDLAVHFAAAQGHLGILKLLVRKYGKEIAEKQDKNSTKPVYFASQEGQLTVLDYLVNELGVDPVGREKSGVSTVHAAVQAGQYKAVKWLISKLGPKYILDKTIDGATPLHMAAAQGYTDILRYFLDNLENKSDVNVQDHIHATPAHDAAEYGQMQAMLLLLKNGADVSIKDTESKTPYELAMEQNHPNVAEMIADLRDNGPGGLAKYEKKKQRSNTQPSSSMQPRTSRQEAEELSTAIRQSSTLQEHRKTQQQHRQESLGMNESDEDEIEHTLGPQGDIYARPKKRKHRGKGSRQGSDEDLLDDSTSHRSFTSPKQNSLLDAVLPLDDSTYALVNHETTSNYSRPSRVRRFHDSDSEITSISSQYRDGRHNVPGYYPPYGGFYPPPLPTRKGHHSSASSLHSSKTGHSRQHQQGYPMMPYGPYGYYPPMPYPPYGYPYPPYGQPGFRPKTTEDRMHLEALQRGQGGHMMGAPMYYHNQQQQRKGRRSKLKKRSRSRQPSRDPSPRGAARKHTDTDIGYGPAILHKTEEHTSPPVAKGKRGRATDHQDGFHPPAPPITGIDGAQRDGDEVVKFDSNFIMMKKSDTMEQVKQLGDTTLHLARSPQHYDGRWDAYIMTDSESEHEVDENYSVAFAAETAAILAIGCVSGLKGLKRLRKGGVQNQEPDKAYLSSAWDEPPMPHKSHSRRGSISGMADPTLKDVSPEDFAASEEMKGQASWAGGEKKSKGKKEKKKKKSGKEESLMQRSASAEHIDTQPQSNLLADEMKKQDFGSVSRNFGQKMLFDALGARESSMLNIASSLAGSMMSLHSSGEEDREGDEFEDTIHMVHGTKKSKRKKREGDTALQIGKDATDRPRSAKKDKQKAKEDKAKKEREKEDKKKEKKDAKKEKQRKKDEEKKVGKQAKGKDQEASAAAVTSPKKPSPPTPVRSAPAPPPPTSPDNTAVSKVTQRPKKPSPPPQERRRKQESSPPPQERRRKQEPSPPPQERRRKQEPSPPPQERRRKQEPSPPPQERRHKQEPLPPPQERRRKQEVVHRPSPPAPYHTHKMEQKGPAATSTPAQGKDGITPKKDRREKAQLKSSPAQPVRSAPTKQTSRHIEREPAAAPLQSRPQPTEKKNTYFDDESDEEPATEIKATNRAVAKQKEVKKISKAPVKEEQIDPDLEELDNVLAQLENIQTGGLMSWFEPNKVTNVDESEDSEDSLPLIVPKKSPSAFKKQSSTPPRAKNVRRPTDGWRFGNESEEHEEISQPPPPQKSGSPYPGRRGRGGGGSATGESASASAGLQRTKHGSPHPGRRGVKQEVDMGSSSSREGSGGKRSSPTVGFDMQTAKQDTEGGEGQHSDFEKNVLSTLEALQDSMSQLKGNPSITQTEITKQTKLQQQLIQNLVTYSQHDPQLVNRLLSMLTDRNHDPSGMESSSSHQLEQLQERILGAHEKTYQETQEHFRTQEALQRAIQRTLEEQTQQQMKGMQANFEMFSKVMEEQLAEQRRKFEEELKKRETEERESREAREKEKKKKKSKDHSKKDKKKRRKHFSSVSDSESSGSDSEGMEYSLKTPSKPVVKTMEAKIFTQDLLKEEPSTNGKARGRLNRRGTEMELSRTTEALSRSLPLEEVGVGEDEEEEDEMYFQHARPITLRRADLKTQEPDDYTPVRPPGDSDNGADRGAQPRRVNMDMAGMTEGFDHFHMLKTRAPRQLETPASKQDFDEAKLRYGKQHIEVNEPHKTMEDVHPLSGAGGELAAILKLRQKRIKEHK